MSSHRQPSVVVDVLTATACAAAATWVKTQAEGILQPLAEKIFPPEPVELLELGADPGGHPENMPPAELADRALHAATGDELSDQARTKAAAGLHWAMGVGSGLAYVAALRRSRWVGVGRGAGFGAVLFGATHASGLPLAGVQEPPTTLPRAWWIWEGGSHVVYAMTVDGLWRAAEWWRARR